MSGLLARPDQQAERLVLYRQALAGLEALAASRPQVFTFPLFDHMERLGLLLVECGQPEAALGMAGQAIARLHAGSATDACLQDRQPAPALMAQMLNVQAHAYTAMGHDADRLRTLTAMVSIHDALVAEGRAFYRWFQARGLSALAACQMHMGNHEHALRTCRESITLFRTFMVDAHSGDRFREMEDITGSRPDFACALLEQARVQEAFSYHAAARESVMEAATILKELCARDPAAWRQLLAEALTMLCILPPAPMAHASGALAGLEYGVSSYRELALLHPHLFMPELAHSLAALCAGQLHAAPPAWACALETGREATALYVTLQADAPDLYRAALADSRYRLSVCHHGLEQIDQATDSLKAALAQYRHLADSKPAEFRKPLARCLLDLMMYHTTYKQYETALQSAHEAAALYTDLAQSDREAYQPDLKKIRDQQAVSRKKLRR